jgi:glutaredoxin 3
MKITKKIRNNIFIVLASILLLYLNFKIFERVSPEKTEQKKDLKVIIYTKNGCRYCRLAKELLENNNIDYEAVELGNDLDLQQKLVNQTKQYTVPYIFINGKFIGGYKNLVDLKNAREL